MFHSIAYVLLKEPFYGSGYDFGYLVKLLTNASLPNDEKEFFDLLHIWFPSIYDVKFIMRVCKPLKGGLQDVADDLGVRDVGCLSLRFQDLSVAWF